jgi:glycosyltransferase involved in cell wall biosynthesis
MSNPLVSIVIPSYNSSGFLRETLNSLLEQTYTPIEIILVDDGSTDNTPEVVKPYISKGVKYIYKKNGGVSSARNLGFERSTGNYICFMDADDWFYPDNIALKVRALENLPETALVHAAVEITDNRLIPTGQIMKGKSGNILIHLLNFSPPAIPCPSNALIRRSVLIDVGLFDEALSTSADFDLWLRIAKSYKVLAIDDIGIKYRIHGAGMFSDLHLQLQDMEVIFNKHSDIIPSNKNSLLKKRFYASVWKSALKKLEISIFFYAVLKWIQN